jgi:uncharacterized protein YegL
LNQLEDDRVPGGDDVNPLALVEFAVNPEPRCACVLLLDTSGSMEGRPIQALNQGVNEYKAALEDDPLASLRVETAIVAFAGEAELVQEFVTVDEFHPVSFGTKWTGTSIAAAVNVAIDQLESRKQRYQTAGISYYRPWVVLITDGESTEQQYLMDAASDRVRAAEEAKQLAFFSVGVEGADMDELNRLTPRGAMPLKGLAFREFFVWLSNSMKRVSGSQVDDEINLPDLSGWVQL